MSSRRVAIILCALCLPVLCGLGAQSAAASKGTTAFTCKLKGVPGGAGFSDSRCREAVATGATYEHLAVGQGTTTDASWKSSFWSVIGFASKEGLPLLMEVAEMLGSGSLVNEVNKSGEHIVTGSMTIEYAGVVVNEKWLTGKGCKVKGGKIVTNTLNVTTQGQGMALKLSPAEGTKYASFEFEGCEVKGLNGPKSFLGSTLFTPQGTTVVSSMEEQKAQETLTFEGLRVGSESASVISGKDPALGETTYTPLSYTTVETP
jgi:hypothetical protein